METNMGKHLWENHMGLYERHNTRRPQEEETHEYTVDRIVGHNGQEAGRKYVIRWYGYMQVEETAEPPSHTPRNFI